MPKVRHPSEFEKAIAIAVEAAIDAEVLVPFETPRSAKLFRARIYDFVRANKEHKTELASRIKRQSCKLYSSHDVSISRPEWRPSPQFPYTLIIDMRAEFEHNLANMSIIEGNPADPPVRSDVESGVHVAPPLEDDAFEYRDDGDTRASVFSDIMKGLDKG